MCNQIINQYQGHDVNGFFAVFKALHQIPDVREKHINYMKLPCVQLRADEWNQLMYYLDLEFQVGNIARGVPRCPSGAISNDVRNFQYRLCYEYFPRKASTGDKIIGCEAIVLFTDDYGRSMSFRAQTGSYKVEGYTLSGRTCMKKFEKALLDHGVVMSDYYIENGKDVKLSIQPPLIECDENIIDEVLDNCFHIDTNSAYASKTAEYHPEWRSTIEDLYGTRQTNKTNKLVLNASVGYMQSRYIGYKLADVSRYAINQTREDLIEIRDKIVSYSNGMISWVGFNTDGAWFKIHNNNKYEKIDLHAYLQNVLGIDRIGYKLGQLKVDHINCKLRYKSKGAYEYIENEKYTPVVRGLTTLDREKPRTEWEWGDIYKGSLLSFVLSDVPYYGHIEIKEE